MTMLHRLDITVTEADFPLAQALVARHVSYGWEEESLPTGESRLRVHCEKASVLEALASEVRTLAPSALLERDDVPEQNWVEAWREFFTPVRAGSFLVLPPWLRDTSRNPENAAAGSDGGDDGIPVFIEPKSAFGTGHHPTTTLCLEAISRLHGAGALQEGQTFLDLGTGTGVLGIACTKLGLSGLGLDIDPMAVSNAEENRILNETGGAFEVRAGSVDDVAGQQFDVVIANILAGPLCDMAGAIRKLVRPGGCLILSGFLEVQAARLAQAYADMGLPERLTAPSAASDPTRTDSPRGEGPSGETAGSHNPQDEWVCFMWPCSSASAEC